ncbi:glycosyltransferase family 2 protein [Leclercia adecarboxylata]|uniref:glycosyltransferase family 2 protein n=1 Tax=Leclercia adecarboxylata TaxID=83655 RepID=UPI0021CF4FA3|nr:glycosyltransferase [Leclercia adecarboxylata]MCU6673728.1 glycosyltransferase [Leclercia adecarboxylata]MCV3303800.1 glycosyltransferase [Leclercia adecarboxylata]MCV3307810.1 glycosyltransferase [Leclercia adecarboxylata]
MQNFDKEWYLDNYKDVVLSGMDPFVHYQKIGRLLNRHPCDPKKIKIEPTKVVTKTISIDIINKNIRGDFNLKGGGSGELHGWLAEIGDNQPRTALIKIDGRPYEIIADVKREDLARNKINQGKHGFRMSVPAEFMDGKIHQLELLDAKSGQLLRQAATSWLHNRKFTSFEEFLAESMVNPMIYAPYREEDKRCFAMMENLRRRLMAYAQEHKLAELVSIVMPAYNREDTIPAAITSVLAQTYPHFELIIIDDGSSDSTADIVRGFDDERIRLIEGPGRSGVSEARNIGLRAAKGNLIAYLDSDNTWQPEYLSAMVSALHQTPHAQAAYSGQYLYRGTHPEPFAIRFASFNKGLLENRNYIDLNCFIHNKSVFKRTGMFDTRLKRFVDWDLILKISSEYTIISVPVLLSNYFYERAENAITNDNSLHGYIDIVREQHNTREFIKGRALLRFDQNEPTKHLLPKPKLDRHVTIVIPNYESLEDIQDCLTSIRKYYDKHHVDIIVVDNASAPEVRAWLSEKAINKFGIKYIGNEFNAGFTYAVNQGIKAAKPNSDIVLLNNDALLTRNSLVCMQQAAYQDLQVGLVVPRQVLFAKTKTITTHVPFANPSMDCDVNLSQHHNNIHKVPLLHDGEQVEINFAPFFCTYMRREVVDQVGGLDAEFGRHYRSDRIMCDYLRHLLGMKIIYISQAVVYHKLQKATDGMRKSEKKSEEFELMFLKNRWSEELAIKLGYTTANWDFN